MIIFNGKQFAAEKEHALQAKLQHFQKNFTKTPHVGCVFFFEDQGGLVYAQEKKQVAKRLGVEYEIIQTSLSQSQTEIQHLIHDFVTNTDITGIIVQKPWRKNWEFFHQHETEPFQAFQAWWHSLTSLIPREKDIDGLNPKTLQLIKVGEWKDRKLVLPATCKAVLSILDFAQTQLSKDLSQQKTLIVGRSELLGTPLFYVLRQQNWQHVQLVGQKEFQKLAKSSSGLKDFRTIISSTGVHNLITGKMVGQNSIVIDAGFPQGDADFDSVSPRADFITPVPNGVGPVTVISLLENVVELCYNFSLNN